jgi:hypothetical protein
MPTLLADYGSTPGEGAKRAGVHNSLACVLLREIPSVSKLEHSSECIAP